MLSLDPLQLEPVGGKGEEEEKEEEEKEEEEKEEAGGDLHALVTLG